MAFNDQGHSNVSGDATAAGDTNVYEWAPADESADKKRKRRWPWVVVPIVGLIAGAAIVSMNLIAPGVSAAGVPIGGLTPSAAQETITERLAGASVTLNTEAGPVTVSGADLGASIDAKAVADEAFANAPAWNFGEWGSKSTTGSITIDEAKASEVLREAMPDSYVEPVNASIAQDPATGLYAVTPSTDGQGVPLDQVRTALEKAMAAEDDKVTVDVQTDIIPAVITTAELQAGADKINALTADVGFYVGEENTVPVDQVTAASWVSPAVDDEGNVTIKADEAKIAEFTTSLKEKVDRPAEDGVWLVDREGNQLEDTNYTKEGVQGRTIGEVDNIASSFAAQLAEGNGHYALNVSVVEPKLTKYERWIEVNLSEQTVYVWENGQVIRSMLASSGLSPNDSDTGTFRINSHVVEQNMGCVPGYDYCTENVKWVMYYNGDEALHGTWWHAEFGTPMSHGCINLSEDNAKWLWDWTPLGTEVWVHY